MKKILNWSFAFLSGMTISSLLILNNEHWKIYLSLLLIIMVFKFNKTDCKK